MQQTEDGAIIIRRFDLTDEEKHRQMEREIFEEPKSAEEKLRAGDPAASLEMVSKAKSKAAPKSEAASSSSGIAQVIGDAVSQFIKPKMKDQATMIQPKPAPQLPKVSTATGTSPMASPKPSPPPTPKSAIGSPKPDPPALPAEAADQPMPKALPFKAPPPTLTTTSPRAPPQKSSAPAAAPSTELPRRLPRRSRLWQVLLPRERVDLSLRLNRLCDHRIPQMVLFLTGNGRAQRVHHQVYRTAWPSRSWTSELRRLQVLQAGHWVVARLRPQVLGTPPSSHSSGIR